MPVHPDALQWGYFANRPSVLKFVSIQRPFPYGIQPAPDSEFLSGGRSLLAEPLANHQRESWEQGHRVRQHHANALLSDYAFDEAYKPAKLGSPIARGAAFTALSADHLLFALAGSSGDPTPWIEGSGIFRFSY